LDQSIHKLSVSCKYCNSINIVKYGTFQGMQRYFCKNCRRKFADNDAIPKMKTPTWIISLALDSYYNGMPLRTIQREINERHGAYYAQSSIYNWIIRFSTEAVRQAKDFQPAVSDRWLFCCTAVITGCRRFWFLDMFDIDSEYLLASKLSETGSKQEIINFLETTHTKTRKTLNHPVSIFVPDNISNYESIDIITGKNIVKPYWIVKANKRRIEEHDKLLKKRTGLIRRLNSIDKAKMLNAAWQIHYNFLNNKTPSKPARKSDIPLFINWTYIINHSTIQKNIYIIPTKIVTLRHNTLLDNVRG